MSRRRTTTLAVTAALLCGLPGAAGAALSVPVGSTLGALLPGLGHPKPPPYTPTATPTPTPAAASASATPTASTTPAPEPTAASTASEPAPSAPATSASPAPSPSVSQESGPGTSLRTVTAATGAQAAWRAGFTGKGVDIALIDTGIAPVQGLTSGNVVNGPDLSFDSQEPELRHLDSFGHGTHMAGLLVGRDRAESDPGAYATAAGLVGMAPDARLVNVKVGATDGAVDVTQVIAALNWVAEHGQRDGLNIRVVSLSYGTDSLQDYKVDPLAHALEAVHRKGILVVVSGGNDGTDKTWLGMPAQDPFALAVGGQDLHGTPADVRDDTVPDFANRGDARRPVDLVAPAVGIHSLRVPGSFLDERHPQARVGDRLLRGSGTSQAAAITAGAAALYLQAHPEASPAQVKQALVLSTQQFPAGSSYSKGSGALHVANALSRVKHAPETAVRSTGTGSLDAARGSSRLVDVLDDGTEVVLRGEVDIFGDPFDVAGWAVATNASDTWDDGRWMGRELAGGGWDGSSWTSRTWSSRTWSSRTWSSRTWSSRTWSSRTWSSRTWSAGDWDSRTWSSRTWSSRTWSSAGWGVDQ